MVRALALVLAWVLNGCGGSAPEEQVTTNRVPVTVELAHSGPIQEVVRATGTVKPVNGADLTVVAPQPARIAELPRAVGDRVGRGDLLVRFEVPALAADVAGRQADLSRAEARLKLAESSVTRREALLARGIAARREVEEARRELADARADVASARSALASASTLAARASVRAPFAGVVAARWHNPGDQVDAANSDPVLRLVDPQRSEVEAAVYLSHLAGIAVGNAARVWGPGTATAQPATVVGRPAAVEPTAGTAPVRLRLAGSPPWPAGAPVEVEILAGEPRVAVLVPAAAVLQEGSESFVYVVGADGHAHRRPVDPGLAAGGQVELRSGVAAGDKAIVEGQNGLPDGALVTVAPPGSRPEASAT